MEISVVGEQAGAVRSGGAISQPAADSPPECSSARRGLTFYRLRHQQWLLLRDVETKVKIRQPYGCAHTLWTAKLWRSRAFQARQRYERWSNSVKTQLRMLYEKWRCIHEHEGAWNANTGNGYYGGLQMDWSFQSAYGSEFIRRWGTADRWPVWAQLEAAERAYLTRGFSPWPSTSRMCGVR